MANSFRTLLVIGDNHEEIAAKYSLDTKVPKYLRYHFDDAAKLHKQDLKFIEAHIKAAQDANHPMLDHFKDLYEEHLAMDDFEFYQQLTYGCTYDENGDAWSTENPDAHYQYEKCYDKRIRQDQRDEAPFSNPFILKDGLKVYSATKGEIDWAKVHMANTDIYYSAWAVCVDDKEPETEDERLIKSSFSNRKEYFANFKNAEEYVQHSCAFWTYGVATAEKYMCGEQETAIDWTTNFYKRFIEPASPDTRFTLYEIKLL